MKKTVATLILLLILFALPLAASAANASASLTGPATVRAGDTITVTFALNGNNLYGVEGTFDFNPEHLEFVKSESKVASPWLCELNDEKKIFIAYDNSLENPISKKTDIFALTFKVKSLDVGTEVTVLAKDILVAYKENPDNDPIDVDIDDATYKFSVAAPKSSNADLAGITVLNGTLTPAFSKDILEYSVTVPHTVEKLDFACTAADSKAFITTDEPPLQINATTTITITVRAENGSTQTYTIKVTRLQDLNYQPSSNANLSSIVVEGFVLSPAFDPEVTEYVVWLPYETTSITVLGTPQDKNATAQVSGGDILIAGEDNPVTITCIAEDGSEKKYLIIAKRAAHGATETTAPDTTDTTTLPPETTEAETTAPVTTEPVENDRNGISGLLTFFLCIITLAVGFIGGFYYRIHYITKKRQRRVTRNRLR
ncbi:MAG: hypothetical protein GX303_06475 [Clostridiales bacterium]|nr:hypothetical protein [Clostridiales bacterium]